MVNVQSIVLWTIPKLFWWETIDTVVPYIFTFDLAYYWELAYSKDLFAKLYYM